MTRRRKDILLLNVAAVAAAIVFFLFAGLNFLTLNRNETYEVWVNHTHEVIEANSQALTNFGHLETAVRGYVVTTDQTFLPDYYSAKEQLTSSIQQLRSLTADNSLQQSRLDSMDKIITERLDLLEELIAFRNDSLYNHTAIASKVTEGNVVTKQFHGLSSRFKEEEMLLLQKRKDDLQHEHNISLLLLICGFIVSLIILFLAYIDLYRQIKRRAQSEQELFLSREWFSKTLVSLGDGVIATDKTGVITFLNGVAEELTGWKKMDAIGKPLDFVFDIVNEVSGLPVVNPIARALKEKKIVLLTNHTILIRKDKTKKYIDDSAAPIIDDQGGLVGGVLIFRDISEQVLARKKLIESERLLKNIIDNTGAIISIRDTEGKFTMVNTAFEKALRINARNIVGRDTTAVISKEDAELVQANIQRALDAKEAITTEEAVTGADGKIHHYVTVRFPFMGADGNVTGTCSISTDITEQKRMAQEEHDKILEMTLRGREAHYKELADSIPELFFSFDKEQRITFWNIACEKQSGKRAAEVIGIKLDQILPEPLITALHKYYPKALLSSQSQKFSVDLEGGGKLRSYLVDLDLTSSGITVLMTDITARKKAEQETLLLVENLQQKNKDLKQFAYIVSHNLRAPIAKIQGLSNLFSTNPLEEELNGKIISNISDELKTLDLVVSDLTDIISVRDLEHKTREEISFHDELHQVTTILSNEIKTSGTSLQEDFSSAPILYSIRGYVHSILMNLVSNAIKYRSPDRPSQIIARSESNNGFICLSVEDNGLGINLKQHGPKLFNLYKRFHNHVEGRGIGLYLVKMQTESLGGKIDVASKEGEGTSFKIFFPKN